MRDNRLSNRVFQSCEAIVALCGDAWYKLADHPWRIIALRMRDRAHGCRSMSAAIIHTILLILLYANKKITGQPSVLTRH